eukprot:TRINITY_DN1620_c0_g2_i1.p3 TRINITY_DN1620_c0_g2~~TRINITY_DN1620_c0_g2_i1.p3  ORF type:complete len:127 (-),score=4.19 TRINITY_DN1620_c0_g2_i1:394-774(-)
MFCQTWLTKCLCVVVSILLIQTRAFKEIDQIDQYHDEVVTKPFLRSLKGVSVSFDNSFAYYESADNSHQNDDGKKDKDKDNDDEDKKDDKKYKNEDVSVRVWSVFPGYFKRCCFWSPRSMCCKRWW